jgi:hypothetical protein
MKSCLVLVLFGCLVSCKVEMSAGKGEDVKVSVNCATAADLAVDCELNQTAGTAEVEVCFDFSVTCANGAVVKAPRSCGAAAGGKISKLRIPGDKLVGMDKCGGDGAPKAVVENIVVKAK